MDNKINVIGLSLMFIYATCFGFFICMWMVLIGKDAGWAILIPLFGASICLWFCFLIYRLEGKKQ